MQKVKPFVACSDYWPFKIPQIVRDEYKAMIAEGQITKPKVVFNKSRQTTLVVYQANQPHEWIKDRIRAAAMGKH